MKDNTLISLRELIKKHKELYEHCEWSKEELDKLKELKDKKKSHLLMLV